MDFFTLKITLEEVKCSILDVILDGQKKQIHLSMKTDRKASYVNQDYVYVV